MTQSKHKSQRQQKHYGGKCELDKSLEEIPMVSSLEKSRHIFVVEAYAVRWVVGRFRKYLW